MSNTEEPQNTPADSAADASRSRELPDRALTQEPSTPTSSTPTSSAQTAETSAVPTMSAPDLGQAQTAPLPPEVRVPSNLGAHQSEVHQTTSFGSSEQSYPGSQPIVGAEQTPASYSGIPASTAEKPQKSGRSGTLLAGLAIGALVGGIVGGGVAAIVAANSSPQTVAQSTNGTVTLNNPETATEITGVAAAATPSVVTLEVSAGQAAGSGSGVIFDEDGYIVSNAHVVTLDGAATENQVIRVKLSDGRVLDGEVVGLDPYADLAVVKIEADDLQAISFADSSNLNVGDLTVAIGAPLDLSNTVTSGVVSALYRGISVSSTLLPGESQSEEVEPSPEDGEDGFPWDFRFENPDGSEGQQPAQSVGSVTLPVVQTDASINPGNSGGALLNAKGELIGINVAIASNSSSSETAGSDGLGFAIPSNLVERITAAIVAGEQPSHGLLGASVGDSSQDDDEDANRSGGLIVDVVAGGAAEEAGLEAGDVITAVNGVPATDGTSVSALIRMAEGGSDATIEFTREGVMQQVEVTLGALEW